mgnify:CR=1 FL=1
MGERDSERKYIHGGERGDRREGIGEKWRKREREGGREVGERQRKKRGRRETAKEEREERDSKRREGGERQRGGILTISDVVPVDREKLVASLQLTAEVS